MAPSKCIAPLLLAPDSLKSFLALLCADDEIEMDAGGGGASGALCGFVSASGRGTEIEAAYCAKLAESPAFNWEGVRLMGMYIG